MREIKFRVYDRHTGIMHVCGTDSHDEIYFEPSGNASYYNLQNGEGSGEGGAYKLMQYTGLKDSLSKEIYEGDILCDCLNEQSYEVIWDDYGMFLFRPIGVDERNQHPFDYYDLDDVKSHASTIVVGNIYENPELLEDTQ